MEFHADVITKSKIVWLSSLSSGYLSRFFLSCVGPLGFFPRSLFNLTFQSFDYIWTLRQSVPITSDVVSSNLDQGEVYSIMW